MEGLGVIGHLEASCKLHKWAWQVSEIESFDKTLRRTDLASGSRSKEPMQLLMCRRMAMLRHGLEAAKTCQLRLALRRRALSLDSERADQLVFKVGDAREETKYLDRTAARN